MYTELEPLLDFEIKDKKIILKKDFEETEIDSESILEIFRWNKKDINYELQEGTELQLWTKLRKFRIPDIILTNNKNFVYEPRFKIWNSIPSNIKVIVFFLLSLIISILIFKSK